MTGTRLLSMQYGYGAAHMPLPFVHRVPSRQWWFLHPSVVGLVGSLVILSLLRSCVTPITMPGRTILWLQPTPETVSPEAVQPAVAVRQAVKAPAPPVEKPERVILKAPIPIVETLPPPEVLLKKQQRSSDRPFYETPKEMMQALPQAPRPDLKKQERTPERNNSYRTPSSPDIPVPDSADIFNRPMASNRPDPVHDQQSVAGPSTFSPMTPEETNGPPLSSALTGGRANPVTVMQGSAELGAGAVVDAPAPQIARASGAGDRRGGLQSVSQPAGFTATVPDAVGVPAPVRSDKAPEEMVTIMGTIDGESTRIATLKQAISKKAQSGVLEAGTYCCTISGVDCRIVITKEKRVKLSFSTDSTERIPFDVVSRLERLLPEGVRPCAD